MSIIDKLLEKFANQRFPDKEIPTGPGVRRMDRRDWVAAMANATRAEEKELNGPSPGGLAEVLGLSRQRVYQLLKEGKLEGVAVMDAKFGLRAFYVTESSIERYAMSNRRPGPKAAPK